MMDLHLAFRSIGRNPGFATLVIAIMALGIGANTTMYSVVRAIFLRPLPFPDQERLVTLWERDSPKGITERRVSGANFVDWRAQNSVFQELGVVPNWSGPSWHFNVVGANGVERVDGIYASSGFFRVLGVQPILGRTLGPDDDQGSGERHVVIGYRYWRERLGGDPAVLGKTINVDTFRGGAFQIVGVMPETFDLPRGAQLWLSLGDWGGGPIPGPDHQQRCCPWYTVFGKLKPGVTVHQGESEMTVIARRIAARYPAASPVTGVKVTPLRETLVGGHRLTFFALFGAVGCVLLIGCANVANLLLSRGISRRREMLTRKALGATPWWIARQLLAEGLVLSGVGALAGLFIAMTVQPVLARALAEHVPLAEHIGIDWTVLLFTGAITVASGVICGLAPLAELRKADWSSRGQTESAFSRRLRHALVVVETAVAVILVAGAGLLVRSLAKLEGIDMGFRTERLLTVSTDLTTGPLRSRGNSARFLEELMPRLAALPGVRVAAATTALPFETGAASQAITREGQSPQAAVDSPQVIQSGVTPRYFQAMGMVLKAGRQLAETDTADGKLVAILNETAARRYWPGENPIGKRFAVGSRERFGSFRQVPAGQVEWREIAGVVSDIRSAGQSAPVEPEVYYSYRQFPIYGPSLVIRAESDPAALAKAVRQEIQAVNPSALITRVRTMQQVAAEANAVPRLRAAVAGIFSLVAIVLGMLGVYGVMSYTVARRTQEIGIRMALGARVEQVSRMVMGRALTLTIAGLILGIAGAIGAGRWISTMLFGVTPVDPITLGSTCLLLIATALAASYLPARRAARIDPAAALRSE